MLSCCDSEESLFDWRTVQAESLSPRMEGYLQVVSQTAADYIQLLPTKWLNNGPSQNHVLQSKKLKILLS